MKSFTDIEQSKKLAEMLPLESADMHYVRKTHDFMGNPIDGEWSHPKYGNPNSKHANYIVQNFESYEKIPCWSLAALLGVIPKRIDESNVLRMDIDDNDFGIWYDEMGGIANFGVNDKLPDITLKEPVDACVEMIVKLYEKGLL